MDSQFAVNAIIDRTRINFLFAKINRFNMQGLRSSPMASTAAASPPAKYKKALVRLSNQGPLIKVADRFAESFPYALSYTTVPTDGVCRMLRRRHGTA